MKLSCPKYLLLCLSFCVVSIAHAQEKVPADSFAVVDGTPLPRGLLEQVVRNNEAKGQQLTPEGRRLLASELAARAALSQEARKKGLDKTAAVKTELELFSQNLLAESLIADHLRQNPVTDAAIQADYDRQVKLLKDAREYKVHDILLSDEAQAKAVLASLKKGESFKKLAQEKSIDPSRANGGDLGWLLAEQITPVIANVIVNLPKGATTQAPVQAANGWHVLKVEDVRPFSPPAFDKAKDQIRQALTLKQRNEFIGKILSGAQIQLAD